jgi:hypothetical protein
MMHPRRIRRAAFRPLGAVLAALLSASRIAQGAGAPPAQEPGVELLKGLDRASYLYLDAALRFACREKILEQSPGWRQSLEFEYMYVYDKVHGFQDYRTVPGRAPGEPTDPSSMGVKRYLSRGSMWVLIFNHGRQAMHRYQLLGMEKMHGVSAVKVGFEPIPPYDESLNDWFGTAWVDEESNQILRVEAMKAIDHERWRRLTAAAETGSTADLDIVRGSSYRINRVITDFEVVKNGMRFPSRVTILSRVYYLPSYGGSQRIHELLEEKSIQTYSKYRFYGVRTSEEVRGLLAPRRSNPPANHR